MNSDMKWAVEKSEYLFRRPWLTVRRDAVRLPDGKVNPEFYILEYPSWVNVIAITEEGDFVMIEQYRHGLRDVFFEIVAGVVEEGEDTLDAAKRELQEETGFGGGQWQLFSVISGNPSVTNNLTYCYLATEVKRISEQRLDATEDIRVHVLHPSDVLGMLQRDEIKQALMAAPLWKYFFMTKK
ncbi:MAG: NUDIX hydrolase [Clostridium sp.]|nr:NUDIX hydrolase [Clostridium sp.]